MKNAKMIFYQLELGKFISGKILVNFLKWLLQVSEGELALLPPVNVIQVNSLVSI
jgi:hypothetical protein